MCTLRHSLLTTLIALGMVACAPAAPPAPTTQTEETAKTSAPSFDEQYQEMAGALALSPGESEALKAAFDSQEQRITEWLEGPEGQALYAEEEALRKATKEKDLEGVRAITRKSVTQRDKFRAIIDETDVNIRATLSPDQLLRWDGHRIAEKLLELLSGITLTADQQNSIREQAPAAIDYATRNGEPNPMAAGYIELEQWVEEQILNPDQRTAFEAIKKSHPMRTMGF